MASMHRFSKLATLSLLFIIYCVKSSQTEIDYNKDSQYEEFNDNYYKSTKKPYYNPFGYGNCRNGKFRFDWMRQKSSFFCPGSVVGRPRSALNDYNEMDEPRIIEGYFAEPGEFPSFVQLKFGHFFEKRSTCGGTLLNEYLVLTAAHCLQDYTSGFAYAGSINHLQGQRRAIKRACSPQEFNESLEMAQPHDWAVLELYGEFRLTREVQPACVNFDYRLTRDIKCVAVGFGQTQEDKISPLLKAAVMKQYEPYVDQAGFIWTSEAVGQSGSGRTCQGDSGGPLYCFENCSGAPKMFMS